MNKITHNHLPDDVKKYQSFSPKHNFVADYKSPKHNFVADDKWKIGIDWNKEGLNEAGRIQVVYDAIKQIETISEDSK